MEYNYSLIFLLNFKWKILLKIDSRFRNSAPNDPDMRLSVRLVNLVIYPVILFKFKVYICFLYLFFLKECIRYTMDEKFFSWISWQKNFKWKRSYRIE